MHWKTVALKAFHKLGYGIYRIGTHDIYKIGTKEEYTTYPPYGFPTYSPWFEDWFQVIYGKVRDRTLLEEHRCYIIYEFCRYCLHLEGDFAECGVYKGGSALLIGETLLNSSVRDKQVHLFDTFTGMPAMANQDPSGAVKEGRFGDTSLNGVKEYLQEVPFVVFHPGLIPETFQPVKDRKFAFVHIDIDLYQTHIDCCDFFYERVTKGGVMVFDDYGRPFFRASAKQAVDEFFANKPETAIALHTGQCIVIKI